MKKYRILWLALFVLFTSGCAIDQPANLNQRAINPPSIQQTQNQQNVNYDATANNPIPQIPPVNTPSNYKEDVSSNPTPSPEVNVNSNTNSTTTPTPTTTAPNGYYENVDGNKIPSPYAAPTVPIGATARCGDGTYSFSQHRSGTCSHHGGVSEWL